jgi:hypothetical protein
MLSIILRARHERDAVTAADSFHFWSIQVAFDTPMLAGEATKQCRLG